MIILITNILKLILIVGAVIFVIGLSTGAWVQGSGSILSSIREMPEVIYTIALYSFLGCVLIYTGSLAYAEIKKGKKIISAFKSALKYNNKISPQMELLFVVSQLLFLFLVVYSAIR